MRRGKEKVWKGCGSLEGAGGLSYFYALFDDPMSRRHRRLALTHRNIASWVWLLIAGFPALVFGQSITPVVVDGDPVPGTAASTFFAFLSADVNDAGEIAFHAAFDAPSIDGIFLRSGDMLHAIALEADDVPSVPGGTFLDFESPALNSEREVAFVASYLLGASTLRGVFLFSNGVLSALCLENDLAAGSGGGIFERFSTEIAISAAGEAVFGAELTGGLTTRGIFGYSASGSRSILLAGASAPLPAPASYASFDPPSVNGGGEVALVTTLETQSGFRWGVVFVDRSGIDHILVLSDEMAPETDGGTFSTFNGFVGPGINEAGQIAFGARVRDGSADSGYFLLDSTSITAVALEGDPAPQPGGGILGRLSHSPSLDGAGRSLFPSSVIGGTAGQGVFRATPGEGIEVITAAGDPVPGIPGEVFYFFGDSRGYAQSESGNVVFLSTTTPSGRRGVFYVPEPSVPTALAVALLGLSLSIRRKRILRHACRLRCDAPVRSCSYRSANATLPAR